MAAGRLREIVTIERRAGAADAYGNTLGAWETRITGEPAEIRPLRGGEDVQAQKLSANGLFEVTVRFSPRTSQILATDRLKNGRTGQAMNIRYIEQPDMRGKFLKIVCEYGVADG